MKFPIQSWGSTRFYKFDMRSWVSSYFTSWVIFPCAIVKSRITLTQIGKWPSLYVHRDLMRFIHPLCLESLMMVDERKSWITIYHIVGYIPSQYLPILYPASHDCCTKIPGLKYTMAPTLDDQKRGIPMDSKSGCH